jgi:hypothetical protein
MRAGTRIVRPGRHVDETGKVTELPESEANGLTGQLALVRLTSSRVSTIA